MRTYCIGDVHGCYGKLLALLSKIGVNSSDHLWFTGDLVNRGEDSLGVLRLVKGWKNKKVVFGNHELYWLACYWCKDLFPELLVNAHDLEELTAWIATWPFFYQTANYLLLHAGFFPFWSLEEGINHFNLLTQYFRISPLRKVLPKLFGNQSFTWKVNLPEEDYYRFIANSLVRMRYCSQAKELNFDLTSPPSEQLSKHWQPWFSFLPNNFPKTILFGHWASLRGNIGHSRAIALDTGCVWGGKLTAYCLETQEYFTA